MTASLNTPITRLFGIRLPIIASGLMWLANADYVGAAAQAGIIGFMTAASFPNPDALRAEIRRCRNIAQDRPFGVNIGIREGEADHQRVLRIVELVIAEGVRFVETVGYSPEPYIGRLHDAGVRVLHKVPAVRHAIKAQSVGADAVTVVGGEAGGHPGPDLVGSFVQAALAARQLHVPLLVAGGVGTGAQIVAALALGADGVAIGTRFLVAEEIWAHRAYKQRLIDADESSTAIIMQTLNRTHRVLANAKAALVQQLEAAHGGNADVLVPNVAGVRARSAYETGNWDDAVLSAGQSVAFADRIEPLAGIVARLEAEMLAAMSRLDQLGGKPETGPMPTLLA